MAWDPEVYNRFKAEREAPFYDALELVGRRPGMEVVDLGCGTGELSRKLADHLQEPLVLGIDSSAAMLAGSEAFAGADLRFEAGGIESWLERRHPVDLIFSNAALQWLPDHRSLFPRLAGNLRPGGQLVVQMPVQHRNRANVLLYQLAAQAPYRELLQGHVRSVSMLEPEDYAEILFRTGGRELQVVEKIYPIVVPDARGVYDFIAGSALRPYLARLGDELGPAFKAAYLQLLGDAFPGDPVFYPFKRILIAARF